MNPVTKQFQFGQSTVTLETGRIARQATGAVLVTMDDVSVLVTVVGAKSPAEGRDFFPLSALPGKDLRRRPYPRWFLQA